MIWDLYNFQRIKVTSNQITVSLLVYTSPMITQQIKPHRPVTWYPDLLKHDTMMPSRIRDISLLVSCTFTTAFGRCGSCQGVVVRCTRLGSSYIRKLHYARFVAYLGTSLPLWFQKQVRIRRIAAYPGFCFARGLNKKSAPYWEFDPQNTYFPKNS